MIRSLLLVALSLIVPGALQADAAEAAAATALVPSVTVQVDPAELRGAAGLERLYSRLQQAARRSCDALPAFERWTESARRGCRQETLESAIRAARHAGLTAHHRACQRNAAAARCLPTAGP